MSHVERSGRWFIARAFRRVRYCRGFHVLVARRLKALEGLTPYDFIFKY